jgi:Flp pilus assembly protein TadD
LQAGPIYGEVGRMFTRKLLLSLPLMLTVASCSRDPKVQAQRYLANGNKFFEKSKYKEASIMYRRALQRDLRFGEAYYRLGLTDIKLASYSDAARMFRRAVELQPENTDAATKLADIYLVASSQDPAHSSQMLKEVRELAAGLLQRNPNSYEGHRLEGQLALMDNDAAKAVKEFDAANRIKPDQVNISLAYFAALSANNQPAEAEKVARGVIEKEKTFAPMYDALYAEYQRLNKPSEAEGVLRQKVENNPKQSSYLLQLASHYYIARRFDDMEAIIRRLADEKQFPEGHMLAGDFFFLRARQFDRAQREYEAGIKATPKDKAAYQKRLVELSATMGKNADADQILASILRDNPKDTDAIAMRAALMLQTGNRDQINQAANDLQSLVTKSPDNHLLRYNLARAQLAKGDIERGRLELESAIKIRPDFVVARELLARIYLAKNDSAKALKEADEIVALNNSDLQGHLIRAASLLGVGDRDKARLELDVVAKIAPENPDGRYQAGFLAWQDKDYKKAEQVFSDLYKSNPKDIRGLVGVVETMVSQQRMGDAIKQMQASQGKEPERRDLKLALANLYVRDQRYDEAIQLFQTLLQSDPKSTTLLLELAETQRRKGDINTAIDTFRRASQAAPNDTRPLLQLGLLMDGTGRREQAKPIYEQILKIEPDHPVALNNLAYIKAEEGLDLDEALTMAQRARQKMPNSTSVKDTLGWIYIKKNLSADAVSVFKDLVQAEPSNPQFHYHYGMALLQKGDKPLAKRELEAAIRNNPSKDEAGKIRQLLASI